MSDRNIKQVVVLSDLHSGSRRALMTEEHELYEEGRRGQVIKANSQQLWLLDCWRDAWSKVLNYTGSDPFAVVFLGDATEGVHRRLTEIVSTDITDHQIIFKNLTQPYFDKAARKFMVRGSQVHVGDTVEMKLAESMGFERHPDTGQFASDRWILDIHGFKVLFRHHSTVTTREYLRSGGLSVEYSNEVIAAVNRDQVVPDGVGLAHRHMYDWWDNGKKFTLITGPWQQTTRYGHTNWSPMIPQPTITVLDWRKKPWGALPDHETFMYTPERAKLAVL